MSIRSASSKTKKILFELERDAYVVWSPDSASLMVEDQFTADETRLMLFRLSFVAPRDEQGLSIDRVIRAAAVKSLRKDERMAYYYPDVIGWDAGMWFVEVGITTTHGETGPFIRHCLGYVVDAKVGRVTQSLSRYDLKKRFGATCHAD